MTATGVVAVAVDRDKFWEVNAPKTRRQLLNELLHAQESLSAARETIRKLEDSARLQAASAKLRDEEYAELSKLRAFRSAVDRAYHPGRGEYTVTVGGGTFTYPGRYA